MLLPFSEIVLDAHPNEPGSLNRIETTTPVLLCPHDDDGSVAAQGLVGGLEIGARPDTPDSLHYLPAGIGGRLFLPQPGRWLVRVARWGATATTAAKIPFSVQRITNPAEVAAWATLASARRATNSQPNVTTTATTIVTLAQMLEGVVAVAVNPLVSAMRFRFGNSPSGTQWDITVAASSRYVFTGAELPLADLQAVITTGISENCKVVRYAR